LWHIDPLLCNRRINQRPFLANGSVNTPTTIEELLKVVFSVEFAPKIRNEDPRPAERIIEREFAVVRRELTRVLHGLL
jgi:hypothetical protein